MSNEEAISPSPNNNITPKEVLEILDFEIKNIQEEDSKHGISHWVLYAALGSFFWLFTLEFDTQTPHNFQVVAIVFILISLTIDQIDSMFKLFKFSLSARTVKNHRTKGLNRFQKILIIPTLESMTCLAAVIFLKNELPAFIFIPYFLYSLFFILSYASYYLYFNTRLKFLIPPFDQSSVLHTITKIYFGVVNTLIYGIVAVGLFSLVAFYFFAYSKNILLTPSNWRIAGLIYGTLFILQKLISITDNSPLDALKEIHRNITLNTFDPETIMNQIRVEVAGETTKEFFQNNLLKELSVHLRSFEFLLAEQKLIFVSIKETLKAVDSKPGLFDELQKRVIIYCDERKRLIEAVTKLQKELSLLKQLFDFYRRFHLIDIQTVAEIDTLFKKQISRTQNIELDLLNKVKAEVMPQINAYIEQKKIIITPENQKLLPPK